MQHHAGVLALLLMAVLSGCLGSDGTETDPCPPGAADLADTRILDPVEDPIVDGHDHWDFAPHAVRTCSMVALHHTTLTDGAAHKYIGELDLHPERSLGAVGVLLSDEEGSGIVLWDISERAAPRAVAFAPTPGFSPVDVKFSEDGRLLYVATQRGLRTDERILEGPVEQVGSNGILAFDVSDPSAPRLAGQTLRLPGGCHMVRPVTIGGQEWLWCAWEGFWAFPVLRADGAVHFGPPSVYLRDEAGIPTPTGPAATRAHLEPFVEGAGHLDMQFHKDAGRTIMVASHWDAGLRVVDVSDPHAPQELAQWKGEGARHYYGQVHSAEVVTTAEGRFILASPELTSDDTVPSIWVLDAADWSAPRLVAEFTAQGDHPSGDLTFTIHQWQVAPQGPDVSADDVRIYMTYNHAGVWVLSLGEILAGDNAAAVQGFHLARAPLDEESLPSRAYLGSWDVGLVDGHIYASDRATGLWTFHFRPDTLGDPRLTWDQ